MPVICSVLGDKFSSFFFFSFLLSLILYSGIQEILILGIIVKKFQ